MYTPIIQTEYTKVIELKPCKTLVEAVAARLKHISNHFMPEYMSARTQTQAIVKLKKEDHPSMINFEPWIV